jgi:acylaminoacyl-peptidase
MQAFHIRSRDGLMMPSYLALPPNETGPGPKTPLPMVLFVHGGPWSRDVYGYNRAHQWLANRGYAVAFGELPGVVGFRQSLPQRWKQGTRRQDPRRSDRRRFGEGIALRDKVAIMGGSYGGYSAFVGATSTPDVFCCAIPIVGITDLVTLMQNRPPHWRRYADVNTEEGRAFLRSRFAPLLHIRRRAISKLPGNMRSWPRVSFMSSKIVISD